MPAAGLRRLCICIDDVGLHAGIHTAAVELVARNRVHALSALVGAPAWRDAAAALAALGEHPVELGLHLDLTEHPLLRGTRRPLAAWLWQAATGGADRRLVRREIEAQLDAFAAALGRPPEFVDGHQHVHQLPGVRDALLDALDARCGTPRPWLRNSRPRAAQAWLKARVIERAGAAGLKALAASRRWPQNAALLGIYDFRGGIERYRVLAAEWLRQARDGDLLMCHPSAPISPLPPDALWSARRAEFDYWVSPQAATAIERERIALQPIGRITRMPAT